MDKRIKYIYLFCLWAMATYAIAQTGQRNSTIQRWDSLKGGIQNSYGRIIYADTIDNYLYAAGTFHTVDNIHTKGIARWNGVKWDSLGAGIDGVDTANIWPQNVLAITRFNNELYFGGAFSSLGNVPANYIGKWNGTSWDSLLTQPFRSNSYQTVCCLKVINNELYVGGFIDTVAGMPITGVAKWNGTNWSGLNFKMKHNYGVFSIAYYNNDIYVGGNFYDSIPTDGTRNIMKYNGSIWQTVGGGINGSMAEVASMVVYNNELYVAGYFFVADGNVGNHIQKWNGTSWSDVGGGTNLNNGQINQLLVHNGKLYAVGVLQMAGGVPADRIAEWDGNKWCGLGSTFDNVIMSETIYKDTLYICGGFRTIDGDSVHSVAKWMGGNYTDTCGTLAGIKQLSVQSNFSVYPNPATNEISLNTNDISNYQNSTITIQNTLGQTVKKISFTKNIDVSDLSQGCYFLQIILSNGEMYKTKFIKQ